MPRADPPFDVASKYVSCVYWQLLAPYERQTARQVLLLSGSAGIGVADYHAGYEELFIELEVYGATPSS
jgi:hypothetical protein